MQNYDRSQSCIISMNRNCSLSVSKNAARFERVSIFMIASTLFKHLFVQRTIPKLVQVLKRKRRGEGGGGEGGGGEMLGRFHHVYTRRAIHDFLSSPPHPYQPNLALAILVAYNDVLSQLTVIVLTMDRDNQATVDIDREIKQKNE